MTISLHTLIERSAHAALDLQRRDGSLPGGHNGPYHDSETPVRNTSHWLITFKKAYDISGDRKFLEAARHAAEYLLCSQKTRPMGASFWHRSNPEKDTCNGLVGQAWTIEALVAASELLESHGPIKLAEEVFLLHPFQEETGLWQRVAADGRHLSIDPTLNHQIWFAAAGGLFVPLVSDEVKRRVERFLDRLGRHLRTHASGLVHQPVRPTYSWKKVVKSSIRWLTRLRSDREAWKGKEVGYHAFNLYGLGLLYQQYPEHSFWETSAFQKAIGYVQSDEYRQNIQESPYGFPYNPPGFEVAFTLEVFGEGTEKKQRYWVSEQVLRCYDWTSHLMTQNTSDPMTHAARLYEATRLPNVEITIPDEQVAALQA